ncbi:MAG: DUF3105 domain-containing protein [Myxococcales bacterium]|nr:DUF3105 domain-containing protein [Myxococcales bacterium]
MLKIGVFLLGCGMILGTVGCDNDNGSSGFSKGTNGENTVQTDSAGVEGGGAASEEDVRSDKDVVDVVEGELPVIVGECGGVVTYIKSVPSPHLGAADPAVFVSHPPTSGPHYWALAKWGAYDVPVPAGNWVHNLEHGGLVLLYRPGANADQLRAALIQAAADTPVDPKCNGASEACQRIIVAPDNDLPSGTAVAAVAWEYLYTAQCVSETDLRTFIDARYAQAPEDFCNGTSFLPEGATLTTFGPCPSGGDPIDIPPIHNDTSSGSEDVVSESDDGTIASDAGADSQ